MGCGVWGVGFYRFWGGQLPNVQEKSTWIFPPITPRGGTFWGKKSLKALSNKVFIFIQHTLVNAVERIKTLELDLEPEGRITEAFDAMERHIDEKFAAVDEKFAAIDKRFDRLEHQFNRLEAKIEVVIEAITGLGDWPEHELL